MNYRQLSIVHASSSFPHSETLADSNHAVATTDQALQIGPELDCCMANTSSLCEGNSAADKRALVGCDEALNNRAVMPGKQGNLRLLNTLLYRWVESDQKLQLYL